jgi:predicted nuclease of predicted toxin-antitoxin system
MSRPRFLADHDLREEIIDGLFRAEPTIELLTARDLHLQRAADPELLAHAANADRVLITHDVNSMVGFAYARIAAGDPMPGVIAIPQRIAARIAIDELLLIWSASEAEEWRDLVAYIPL